MKGRIFIVIGLLIALSTSALAQNEVLSVAKAQALFIYNFSRHIGWPETSFSSDEFLIGVVGSKDLYNEVTRITKDKQVGKYKIIVKLFNSAEEVSSTHMLVFGNKFHGNMEDFNPKMGSFPVLIINTQDYTANTKGDIVFKLVDQKMNYVVSRNAIKNKGLLMSKQLIDMAFNVM